MKKKIKLLFKHKTDDMRKMLFVNGVNIMADKNELSDEHLHELLTWHNTASLIQGMRSPIDIINALCEREEEGLELARRTFALGFAITTEDKSYKIDLLMDLLEYEEWPTAQVFCMSKMDAIYDRLIQINPIDEDIEVKTSMMGVFTFAGLMYFESHRDELHALLRAIQEGFSDN